MDTRLVIYHLICFALVASGQEPEDAPTILSHYEGGPIMAEVEPKEIEPRINDDERIVGGRLAGAHYRPWQVLLMTSEEITCGGIVIASQWVLTAAHCIPKTAGVSITAVAGTNRRCIETIRGRVRSYDDGAEFRNVTSVYHPGYNNTNKNDIALYKMDSPFTLGANIQAAFLAAGELSDDEMVEVSGWGSTSKGGQKSCELMTATIPKVSDSLCRRIYGTDATQICAGYMRGGVDACQGDSGGPLVMLSGSFAVLYGVVIYGFGCALPNYPTVFTKVSAYISWIQETMTS